MVFNLTFHLRTRLGLSSVFNFKTHFLQIKLSICTDEAVRIWRGDLPSSNYKLLIFISASSFKIQNCSTHLGGILTDRRIYAGSRMCIL